MRRTDQEFKAEVLRRSREYKAKQAKRRKKILTVALCTFVCVVGLSFWSGGFGMKATSSDSAAPESMEIGMADVSAGYYGAMEEMNGSAIPEGELEPAEGTARENWLTVRAAVDASAPVRTILDPEIIDQIRELIAGLPGGERGSAGSENADYEIVIGDADGEHRYLLDTAGFLYSQEEERRYELDQDACALIFQLLELEEE